MGTKTMKMIDFLWVLASFDVLAEFGFVVLHFQEVSHSQLSSVGVTDHDAPG